MTVEAAVFTCSICGEPSKDICVFCTKDACANHRCERCKRCSDCCECEVPLSSEQAQPEESHAAAVAPEASHAVQAALSDPGQDGADMAAEEPDIEEQLMPPEEPLQ